jgi:hypothetical protein
MLDQLLDSFGSESKIAQTVRIVKIINSVGLEIISRIAT